MKRVLSLLSFAAMASSQAASTSITAGDLATSFSGSSVVISEVDSNSYDLSDLTGLTTGAPIQVTLTLFGTSAGPPSTSSTQWTGGFDGVGTDPVTVTFKAIIGLAVGAFSNSTTDSGSFGPVPAVDIDGAVGFADLVGATSFSVVVPWGTDLSNVGVSLYDQSFFTGAGGAFNASSMSIGDGLLTTSSVPEPSQSLLGLLGGLVLLRRRR